PQRVAPDGRALQPAPPRLQAGSDAPIPPVGVRMEEWIARLFSDRNLLRMGHAQRAEDLNLGLGWLYYGLARVIRPAQVVVVGSFRGFVPLILGKALADNSEGGEVVF